MGACNRMFSCKVSSKLVLLGGKVKGDGAFCQCKSGLSTGRH